MSNNAAIARASRPTLGRRSAAKKGGGAELPGAGISGLGEDGEADRAGGADHDRPRKKEIGGTPARSSRAIPSRA
ncbi:MAG: hypothetical protein IPK80_00790 [Nannocystis sp.]|nr:hypothetical protein [Nannocystis sp.]